jgi:ubiquinone/menaquinone biosynthesis C-methylase UbiE
VADGRNMPFGDNSFDIVFSNSVIEHLGDKKSQEQFAKEIRRVGKAYWVQTPNKMFLIEPHLITPFVHWFLHRLPKKFQKIVLRYFTVWGLLTKPSKEQCENFLNEVRLLSFKEMKELFPDANIICERFFGLKKSLIAVKLSDER